VQHSFRHIPKHMQEELRSRWLVPSAHKSDSSPRRVDECHRRIVCESYHHDKQRASTPFTPDQFFDSHQVAEPASSFPLFFFKSTRNCRVSKSHQGSSQALPPLNMAAKARCSRKLRRYWTGIKSLSFDLVSLVTISMINYTEKSNPVRLPPPPG